MPVALAVALIGIRVLMDIATATAGTPGPRGLTGATGATGPQGMFLLSDTFIDLKYFIIILTCYLVKCLILFENRPDSNIRCIFSCSFIWN